MTQKPSSSSPPGAWLHRIAPGLAIGAALAALAGCTASKPQSAPVPGVDVMFPRQQELDQYVEATGQVAAINIVPLMARVQGNLQAIGYKDGAFVRAGTNLFTIEQAPYLAQLGQAQANLASAEARAHFADLEARRYAQLAEADSASRQQAEQTDSDRDSAEAAVKQAQAALTQARITYGYTRVTAPFDGLVSAHQANLGALVGGSGPTPLATIVQLDPIWVNFSIPEQDVDAVRGEMAAGAGGSLPVSVALQGEAGFPHVGRLDYVSPVVDQQTGTLQLRGRFLNEGHRLLPGNFVQVRVRTGVRSKALLVPEAALGDTQGSRTLMVVDREGRVEQRTVVVGTSQTGWTEIRAGLHPNDRVIVDGLQSLREGETVEPHLVSAASFETQADHGQ